MNNIHKIRYFYTWLKSFCSVAATVISAVFILSNQISAAGILDPTFGNGGRALLRYQPGTINNVSAAALQPDGKIILAGATSSDLSIVRINSDGSPDNSFGTGGWVVTSFGLSSIGSSAAYSVVVLPDGKILAGGASNGVMVLLRCNRDGSLDTSFDGDGKVVTDIDGGTGENVKFLLPQADGKVIAVGEMSPSSGTQNIIILARYNTDGSLDTTFGDGGKYKLTFSNIINYLHGAAIRSDGKILLSGRYATNIPGCIPTKSNSCSQTGHFLNLYNQEMIPDRKFGRLGKVSGNSNYFNGISLTPDGYILVGGQPRARRYNANGWLETLFESVENANSGPIDGAFQLKQRADRSVVGCYYPGIDGDFAVSLFGADGKNPIIDRRDFADTVDSCWLTLIQPDDKILAIGKSTDQSGSRSFAVVRYLDIRP